MTAFFSTTFYLENSPVCSKGKRIVQYTAEYPSPRFIIVILCFPLLSFFDIYTYVSVSYMIFSQEHLIVLDIISVPKYYFSMHLLYNHNTIRTAEKNDDSVIYCAVYIRSVSQPSPENLLACLFIYLLDSASKFKLCFWLITSL